MTFRKLILILTSSISSSLLSQHLFAVPIAQDDDRTLPRNGADRTINVLENDTTTGDDPNVSNILTVIAVTAPTDIATGATFGTLAINSASQIIFTPPLEFGNDVETVTFSYTVADEEGLTDTGVVTVTLTGPFTTFANDQTTLNVATVLESVCDEYLGANEAELTAGQALLADQCEILEAIAGNNPDNQDLLSRILEQIAPEETFAQTRLAIDSNRTQVKAVAQRVHQQSLAKRGTSRNQLALNGRNYQNELSLAPGAGDNNWGARPRWGVFANAQIDSAEREKTALENGYESDTQGVTVGADYFLTNNALIGSTLGYNTSDLEYVNSDGELDAKVTNISLFGAYFLNDFSFYAQTLYAWLDYESQRNISYSSGSIGTQALIRSTTGGTQMGLNTRADWLWQKNAITITPYLRLDYLNTHVDSYEEVGSSGLEMAIGKQQSSQLTTAFGVQGSYVLNMSWGVLTPNLEFTYISETNSDRDPITARFAVDTDPSRTYSITNDGGDNSFYQATIGASAVFPRGISAFFNYSGFLGYQNLDASQIQFGVRQEF